MSHPEFKHIGTPEDRCIEECSELILAISKAKRFGWFSDYHGPTNMDTVRSEIADVMETIDKLKEHMLNLEKINGSNT